jgi:cytidylate kinase
MIVAIDGPAGSGKTTVAKLLAQKLDIYYLDTGATYRALTYAALEKKLDLSNANALRELAQGLDLEIKDNKIYLNGLDVSSTIRTPIIDRNISLVVSFPEVREVMVALQRKMASKGNFVVEGRDITTVVFPQAQYKFYLDADPSVRAERRFKELRDKRIDIDFTEVKMDLEKRDAADKNRKTGPLRISDDAICIDTTNLTIEESVGEITKYINLNK